MKEKGRGLIQERRKVKRRRDGGNTTTSGILAVSYTYLSAK
jgi:hypothetical protein